MYSSVICQDCPQQDAISEIIHLKPHWKFQCTFTLYGTCKYTLHKYTSIHTRTGSCNALLMCTRSAQPRLVHLSVFSLCGKSAMRTEISTIRCPILNASGELASWKWDDTWPLLCMTNTWLLKTESTRCFIKDTTRKCKMGKTLQD